jgi:hypothetical protein
MIFRTTSDFGALASRRRKDPPRHRAQLKRHLDPLLVYGVDADPSGGAARLNTVSS